VAVSLALAARDLGQVTLADCDVEEPNAHVFLSPDISHSEPVSLPVPQVDEDVCTYCGACARACRFGALAVIGKKVLFHPELCHGCGLCTRVCPVSAIVEVARPIGRIERGLAKGIRFWQGVLNPGEPMATPIIRALKRRLPDQGLVVLDAPPGTACPVIETLKGVDFALLVAEPTPFGLHDLKLAVEVTRELGIPAAAVISKDGIGTDEVERHLASEGIPLLLRIPMDRKFAEAYAQGISLVEAFPDWKGRFIELADRITMEAKVPR